MQNQFIVLNKTVLSYSRMEDAELASWDPVLETRRKSSQITNFDHCILFCELFIL
jgi:hypothetical protein